MKNLKQPLKTTIKMLCTASIGVAASLTLMMGAISVSNAAIRTPPPPPTHSKASIIIAPVSRSFEQMLIDDALNPVTSGTPQMAPFRSTMGDSEYQQAKQTANQAAGLPARSEASMPSSLVPATLKDVNCTGLTQSGWVPPDTHGAMGHSHYVQVVNSAIRMYDRAGITGDVNIACGPAVKSVSLNAFVGYTTKPLFDPRVVYDPQWKRWIVTAPAFPESSTIMRHFVAVSKTSDPTLGWWIYNLNMGDRKSVV